LRPVHDIEIVARYLFGFVEPRQILAELREDRADALRLLRGGGAHRVFEMLARHEPRHRSADERRFRRALAQPPVRRHREQCLAG